MSAVRTDGRRGFVVPALAACLALLALLSLCIGRYPLGPARIALALADAAMGGAVAVDPLDVVVVTGVRLPRIVLAMVSGAALALAGTVLQGVFRNPLVGPQVIGVSNGAAFGSVVALLAGLSGLGVASLAFLFAVLALALVYLLARAAGSAGTLTLILSGMVVGAFFAALVGAGQYLADPEVKLPGIVYWLLGSFVGASPAKAWLSASVTVLMGGMLHALRWRLNLLSLSDEDAAALGVEIGRLRWGMLVMASALVAGQVAVSGCVGWVGLVVPHFARMLVGPDHRTLVPASALLGAIYLLAIDDAARGLFASEVPIGILTGLIGTPVFAALLWRHGARGWARG